MKKAALMAAFLRSTGHDSCHQSAMRMDAMQRFYAYLDISNPMVAWEVAIGRVCSVGMLKDDFGLSIWAFNMLRRLSTNGLSVPLRNELLLEEFRIKHHPEAVSRMKGIYFFESEADCRKAIELWRLPASHEAYISAVDFETVNCSRHDSMWITDCMGKESTDWFSSYLRGESLWESPLTEVLAEGFGYVRNTALRSRAAGLVIERTPKASFFLVGSICGLYQYDLRDLTRTVPCLTEENGQVVGHHYMYLQSFDDNQALIGSAIADCHAKGLIDIPIIYGEEPSATFQIPDCRDRKFVLDLPDSVELFHRIHHP